MKFYYVYILVSEREPSRHYVGMIQDLKKRLQNIWELNMPMQFLLVQLLYILP